MGCVNAPGARIETSAAPRRATGENLRTGAADVRHERGEGPSRHTGSDRGGEVVRTAWHRRPGRARRATGGRDGGGPRVARPSGQQEAQQKAEPPAESSCEFQGHQNCFLRAPIRAASHGISEQHERSPERGHAMRPRCRIQPTCSCMSAIPLPAMIYPCELSIKTGRGLPMASIRQRNRQPAWRRLASKTAPETPENPETPKGRGMRHPPAPASAPRTERETQ